MELSFVKQLVEMGLSLGVFGLCCWIVYQIVIRLCATMDRLVNKMDVFMNRVKTEHEASLKNQENIQRQHEGMIETLGRINGYKK